MKKILSLLLVFVMLVMTACSSSSATTSAETTNVADATEETKGFEKESFKSNILFCGSTSLYPIISSLASSFTEEYVSWDKVNSNFEKKNISIYVAPGGSGVGVSAAIDGTCDFGMLARDIKDSEVEKLGADYQQFMVAKDALTVSVNIENPIVEKIDDMDTELIQKIFSGEITTWNEVESSLPNEKINVYIRDLSGGAYEVFQNVIMKDKNIVDSATQSASMTELAKNIANDKWGIGYAGFGAYNKINQEKQVLFAMKVDGNEATVDNIKSGTYTVQRPVMFVTSHKLADTEKAFVDYIFSDKGRSVVEANGYIPAF